MRDMITVRRDYISQEVRDYIFIRDGKRCRYCGQIKGNFHLDHVYPVSKGGETSIDNLVTSCQSCNSAKHNKIGMWPKPVGYFDKKPKQVDVSILTVVCLALGVAMLANSIDFLSESMEISRIGLLSGFIFCSLGLGRVATGR